jgi:hypothetical protein
MAISQIVSKIGNALTNTQQLKMMLQNFIKDEDMREEEVYCALLPAFFQTAPTYQSIKQFQKLLLEKDLQEVLPNDQRIYLLYAAECLVKKYEKEFDANGNLLNAMLQEAVEEFLPKDIFQVFRGENYDGFVPAEFYEKCLRMATQFFEWFD